jgi:hypothetical protein
MGRQSFELILSADDKTQHLDLENIENKDILFSNLLTFGIQNKIDLKDIQMSITGNGDLSNDLTIQEFNQLKTELTEQLPQAFLSSIKDIPEVKDLYQHLLELKAEKDISYNRFSDAYSSNSALKELFDAIPDTRLLFNTLDKLTGKPSDEVLQAILEQPNLQLFNENFVRLLALAGQDVNQRNALLLPTALTSLARLNPEDIQTVLNNFKFKDMYECKKLIRGFDAIDKDTKHLITQYLQQKEIIDLLENLNIKNLGILEHWAKQEHPIDLEKMKSLLETLNDQGLSQQENATIYRRFLNDDISELSKDYKSFLDFISNPLITKVPLLSQNLSSEILKIEEEPFLKNLIQIQSPELINLMKESVLNNWDNFKTCIQNISEDKLQYVDVLSNMELLSLPMLENLNKYNAHNIEMMKDLPITPQQKAKLLIAYMNHPIPLYFKDFLGIQSSPEVLVQLTNPENHEFFTSLKKQNHPHLAPMILDACKEAHFDDLKSIVQTIINQKALPFMIQTMDTLGLLTVDNLLALKGHDLTVVNQHLEDILKLGRSNDISASLFSQSLSQDGLKLSENKESLMAYFLTRDLAPEIKNTLSLALLKPENNDFFTHLQSINNSKLNEMLLECFNNTEKLSQFKSGVLASSKEHIVLLDNKNLLSLSVLPLSKTISEIFTTFEAAHQDPHAIILNALENRNSESALNNILKVAKSPFGTGLLLQMHKMDLLEPGNIFANSSALLPKNSDINSEIERISTQINTAYNSNITISHPDTNLMRILFPLIINDDSALNHINYKYLSDVLDTPFAKSLKDVDRSEMISNLIEKSEWCKACLKLDKHQLLDQDHFNALMTTKHPISEFIDFLVKFPGINLAGLDQFSSIKDLMKALDILLDKMEEDINQTELLNQMLTFNQLDFIFHLPKKITATEWDNFIHIPKTSYDLNNFDFTDLTSLNRLGLLNDHQKYESNMSAIHDIAKAGFTADSFKASPKTLDKLIDFIAMKPLCQNELLKLPILSIAALMDIPRDINLFLDSYSTIQKVYPDNQILHQHLFNNMLHRFDFKDDAERLKSIHTICPLDKDSMFLTPTVLKKLLECNKEYFQTSLQCLKIMSVSDLLQPDKMDALFNHHLGIKDALVKLQFQMKTPGSGANVQPDEFATAFPPPNPEKITEQAFKDVFQRNLGWDITVAVCKTLLSLFSPATPEPKKDVAPEKLNADDSNWGNKFGVELKDPTPKHSKESHSDITVASFNQKKP